MKQRGRKSASDLAITIQAGALDIVERLKPPAELTDEEVEIWARIVNSEPADWFSPSTVPLLAQYCRHVIQAKRVGELVERATSDPNLPIKSYDRLLKMQERESRAIAGLATKMRLAQQSTTNHRGNRQKTAAQKPWD